MNDSVLDTSYRVTADELRQFIERFERLDAEKKDLAEQQKEVMAEAKGRGYDTKVLRKLVAMRRRDRDDLAEEPAARVYARCGDQTADCNQNDQHESASNIARHREAPVCRDFGPVNPPGDGTSAGIAKTSS